MNRLKLTVSLLFILFLFCSGCSKYKIYNMARNHELSKAGLSTETARISIGKIVYLDNIQKIKDKKNIDTIIMVHGFGANKDNWLRFAYFFSNKYRVIALDLPGHGSSVSDMTNFYSITNQAKWLNEFMEAIHVKKANIIGNSMGGAIAAKFTSEYPERVISMALMDSGGVNRTESEYIGLLKKGINPLVVSTPEEYKHLLNFVMEKKPYIPGAIIDVLTEKKIARKDLDEKIFKDVLTDITKVSDAIESIKKPTLILWGDSDRVLHVDNAQVFHEKISGSKVKIFKGVGHLPMVEIPKKAGKVYLNFLNNIQ